MSAASLTPEHVSEIERGLADLRCACAVLDDLIGRGGSNQDSAALALIQKAGAIIETTLRDAAILDGRVIVGGAAEWLDITMPEGCAA